MIRKTSLSRLMDVEDIHTRIDEQIEETHCVCFIYYVQAETGQTRNACIDRSEMPKNLADINHPNARRRNQPLDVSL